MGEILNDLYFSYFALTQMMHFLEYAAQRKFLASVKKKSLVHLRWKDTGSWYIHTWVEYGNLRRIKDVAIYRLIFSSSSP